MTSCLVIVRRQACRRSCGSSSTFPAPETFLRPRLSCARAKPCRSHGARAGIPRPLGVRANRERQARPLGRKVECPQAFSALSPTPRGVAAARLPCEVPNPTGFSVARRPDAGNLFEFGVLPCSQDRKQRIFPKTVIITPKTLFAT